MEIKDTKTIPLLALFLLILLILQQTLKIGGNNLLSAGIQNSAHGAWFALVTYLIWRIVSETSLFTLKFSTRLRLTASIAIVIALMSEFARKVSGRVASWEDFFLDMCGMFAAMLVIVSFNTKKSNSSGKHNAFLLIMAGLLLVFSLYPFYFAAIITLHHKSIEPRLLDFNSYLGYANFITEGESQLTLAPQSWNKLKGQQVMKIKLPQNRWPGFKLNTLISNWQPYSYLRLELFNDSTLSLPLTISIRVDSLEGDGTVGYKNKFKLIPGANSLRASIDELLPDRKNIEWKIRSVIVYTKRPFFGRTLYAGGVRLE